MDLESCFEGFFALAEHPEPPSPVHGDAAVLGDDVLAGFEGLAERGARGRQQLLPAGTAYRSAGHARLMRDTKDIKTARQLQDQETASVQAVRQAWNQELGLRVGDQLCFGNDESLTSHPNTWTHPGLLKVGWKQLGKRASGHRCAAGLGETRRGGDALLCVAAACDKASRQVFLDWLAAIPAGQPLHVEKHYDATSLMLRFGGLEDALHPVAKYLIPHEQLEGRYRAVSLADFRKVYPKIQPSKGLLEFFAQTLIVCTSNDGEEDSRVLLLRPSILTHCNASTTYTAVETTTPGLTMARLKELAARHPFITFSEIPDNHSVNVRKRAFTSAELPPNVFVTPLGCCAHLLHRVIVSSIREDDIVGDCHAVYVITRNPAHRDRLVAAAFAVIEEDFDVMPGSPPAEATAHMREILEHTLLRTLDHTAGSLVKRPLQHNDEALDHELDQRFSTRRLGVNMVAKYCNSDPRKPKIVHYCNGCCISKAESLQSVKAAVVQGGLLGGYSTTTPSKSRHGSTTEALGEQAAGFMCFNILPRAMARAFPRWQSGGINIDDPDDKRAYMRSKTHRAKMHCNSDRAKMLTAVLSWVAEPIDYLWMRLQYLDGRCSSMLDVQSPRHDPFLQCMRSLSQLLLQPVTSGGLRTVYNHYESEAERLWMAQQSQELIASMVCQIHSRFMLLFKTWPFPLAKIADVRLDSQDREKVIDELWAAHDCCLEEHFGKKLRALYESRDTGRSCSRWSSAVARHTKLANMELERLLALMKASTAEKYPLVEHLAATSLLTQVLREHRRAEGDDPRRAQRRADLLRQGVPLACKKKQATQTSKMARGVFWYVKSKMARGKRTKQQRNVERSRLSQQFWSLPADVRDRYVSEEGRKEEQHTEDPDSKYQRLVGNSLFGLSSRQQPRKTSVFAAEAARFAPQGSGPGLLPRDSCPPQQSGASAEPQHLWKQFVLLKACYSLALGGFLH